MKTGLCLVIGLLALGGCAGPSKDEARGGSGGSGGSGGLEGGGGASACETDCAAVDTGNACTTGKCNEATGLCEVQPNDGATCDDGDFCTVGEACSGGECAGGEANTCGLEPDPCTDILCDGIAQGCAASVLEDGTPCQTGDLCIINPMCVSGVCTGAPQDCAGFSSRNECNVSVCNPTTGVCEPTSDGVPCSDGDACTVGETCSGGFCLGGGRGDFATYFAETFMDNAAGWALEGDWQIGPAVQSACGTRNDPAYDYTASVDNGVAGNLIGGCPDLNAWHDYEYLTSPPIDTSSVVGQCYLEFWRWLQSGGGMQNSVEVFDGAAWNIVWEGGDVLDDGWTRLVYDVTAYKSANMKIRFGFALGENAYAMGGWTVDDVTIVNQVCD